MCSTTNYLSNNFSMVQCEAAVQYSDWSRRCVLQQFILHWLAIGRFERSSSKTCVNWRSNPLLNYKSNYRSSDNSNRATADIASQQLLQTLQTQPPAKNFKKINNCCRARVLLSFFQEEHLQQLTPTFYELLTMQEKAFTANNAACLPAIKEYLILYDQKSQRPTYINECVCYLSGSFLRGETKVKRAFQIKWLIRGPICQWQQLRRIL